MLGQQAGEEWTSHSEHEPQGWGGACPRPAAQLGVLPKAAPVGVGRTGGDGARVKTASGHGTRKWEEEGAEGSCGAEWGLAGK